MDLSVFFEKLPPKLGEILSLSPEGSIGKHTHAFHGIFPDWKDADLILIGGRNNGNTEAHEANAIREEFYSLSSHQQQQRIVDLGNLKAKESYEDYLNVLGYVLAFLLEEGVPVAVIGGKQSQSWGMIQSFKNVSLPANYVHLDKSFDIEFGPEVPDSYSYNRLIFEEDGDILDNFTNLAFQRFEVKEQHRDFLAERHYSALRLGDLNARIQEAEPELRLADLLSIDHSVMRHAESPGSSHPSPAGLDAIQACTLARYAGLGYRLKQVLISEYNALDDLRNQSAKMSALILWYILDGKYNQWDDFPAPDRSNLRKYAVQLNATIEEIPFYKHLHSDRWWMEVPYPESLGKAFPESRLIPCSENDYEIAKTDNIPERWWFAYNRMMK
ncbi:MAG: arginase family protein [Bacteroidia bacterium]|nr:arginase family protein [Bacteroidia bacterium]